MSVTSEAVVTPDPARPRRAWSILAGLLLGVVLTGLVLAAGPAAPAAAHANLLETFPANGEVIPSPAGEVTLTFSEPVRLVPDRVIVVGPDGNRVDEGNPRADGEVVTIPLGDDRAEGTYLVSYRVISADSHPVAGSFTYSVGVPSAEPPELVEEDLSNPVVSVAVSANRYLGYAGLVLLIGPALMLALLWPQRLSRRAPARMLWTGVGLVAFSTLAGMWLQVPYSTGGGIFEFSGPAMGEVLGSAYGTAQVVRLGVLMAAAVLLRPLLAGTAARSDLVLLAGLGVVGLGTWPVAGHPIASPVPAISVAVQTLHIAAAVFWLGGLVVLVGLLLRQANERELGAILPVWSGWAAIAVSVLLVAGVVQGVIEIGPPQALWLTAYGWLLLAKVVLFAVVVGVAGYSRRLVRNRTAAGQPVPLRRAVLAEAAVLACVLVVSSVLVQTTPGRTEAEAATATTTSDFVATLESDLYSVQVIVEPAEQGMNVVHLYAYTPDGEPAAVAEWQVTAAPPGADVEPLDVPVLPLSDDHATGQVSLPTAGDWEFRFTLRLSEVDQATVTATVPIR